MTPPCLLTAWSAHETELRDHLRNRLKDRDAADDLLHGVFIKALRQGSHFCQVENARARLKQRLEEGCQVRFDDNGKVCCFTPRIQE